MQRAVWFFEVDCFRIMSRRLLILVFYFKPYDCFIKWCARSGGKRNSTESKEMIFSLTFAFIGTWHAWAGEDSRKTVSDLWFEKQVCKVMQSDRKNMKQN